MIAHVHFIQAVCISVVTKEKFDLIGKRKGPVGSCKTAFWQLSAAKRSRPVLHALLLFSLKTTVVVACPVGVLYSSMMLS